MGRATNRRHLFNLSQAKSYMQTMLVASGATQLIEQGKTTSIRGLYYLLKHTIEGTKEETFADQDECDPVIEDCEVLLNSLREELHLYARKKGTWWARSCWSTAATRSTAADGLRRLRHPLDRRAGGDPVQAAATPSSSCTSKRTRSGSGSTRTSSGGSTSASSRTAAASPRAASAGSCTACTTN